jgi:predicted AAA+ superfamily ATPase
MLEQFSHSNLFRNSIEEYISTDKHLRDLASQRFVWRFPWLDIVREDGVYLLAGGRQIGKTSSLKLFIKERLLEGGYAPTQILYLPCDTVVDRVSLLQLLREFFASIDRRKRSILVIDEVTFVPGWQLSVKALLDEGVAQNSTILISGSDSILLEDGAAGFPGVARRGRSGRDFTLTPLSFQEYLQVTQSAPATIQAKFASFLQCGGYLTAINDLHKFSEIPSSTYLTYQQWLLSDFVRKGKDRRKLIELLRAITLRLATQVSFTSLAADCQAISTETAIDYIHHLERLGILRVLGAFDQNSLGTYPKKARKIHLRDPFIAESIVRLLKAEGILPTKFRIPEGSIVEAVIGEAVARTARTAYIKATGEVDIVAISNGRFVPIEVKWSDKVRRQELKQILKYRSGLVLSKQPGQGMIAELKALNIYDFLSGDVARLIQDTSESAL